MRTFLSLLFISFALSACAATIDPTKIDFPENSEDSLILIQVPAVPIYWELGVAQYIEEEKALNIRPFKGIRFFEAAPSAAPQYLGLLLDPGTYVFEVVAQQARWTACFNDNTKSFTVKPGEAVFLGNFNVLPHLAQIEAIAKAKGNLTADERTAFGYYDGILPPQITNPGVDTPDFLQAKAYEAAHLPKLRGRLKPGSFKPATFRTGTREVDGMPYRTCMTFYKDLPKQTFEPPSP